MQHMATSSFVSPGILAPTPRFDRPTFLMCPPEWYGVAYVHNPWMAGNVHRSSRDLAFAQWKSLYNLLRGVADVRLLHPEQDCPDMVFLGHGALIGSGIAAMASFTHVERRPETTYLAPLAHWARLPALGHPPGGWFRGGRRRRHSRARDGSVLWAAHGVRTCRSAHAHVADAWGVPVRSLHLVDPRFYHLDTCFAPLAGGYLLYYPEAFDGESLARDRRGVSRRDGVLQSHRVRTPPTWSCCSAEHRQDGIHRAP